MRPQRTVDQLTLDFHSRTAIGFLVRSSFGGTYQSLQGQARTSSQDPSTRRCYIQTHLLGVQVFLEMFDRVS